MFVKETPGSPWYVITVGHGCHKALGWLYAALWINGFTPQNTVKYTLDISQSYVFEDLTNDAPQLARDGELWGVVRKCKVLAEV